jgi:hypothetical protein
MKWTKTQNVYEETHKGKNPLLLLLDVKQARYFSYIKFCLRNYSDEATTFLSSTPTEWQLLLHECKL